MHFLSIILVLMDEALHDNDQVKQLLMYKLIHQLTRFEQMVLIYKENVVKPIFVKLLLETRTEEEKKSNYISACHSYREYKKKDY